MKKLLVLVFAIALCLGVLCLGASADGITPPQPTGSGTAENPYQIGTAEELYWFAEQVNSGKTNINAELTDNITINTDVLNENGKLNSNDSFAQWTPIGTSNAYTGTFDGQGYTISGLYVNITSSYSDDYIYAGLFGYVGSGGQVKNVKVADSYISVNVNACVGGVCGYSSGTITNCSVSDSAFSGTYDIENGIICSVGGVCGYNYGTITNCYNDGTVKGSYYTGGVCGGNGATITNCYNTGSVTGTNAGTNYVGGVCGNNYLCTITNCYWLSGTATIGIGTGTGEATSKTTTEFASGEVAWLLNSYQENGPWRQTLDEDDYPVLDITHKVVVKLTVDGTISYLNKGDSFSGEDGKAYFNGDERVGVPCEVTADTTLTSKTLVTVTADSFDCFVGDDKPTLTYTTSPVVEGLNVMLNCDADMLTAGEYAITISGPETDKSHAFDYVNGVLKVRDSCVVTVDGEVHYVHPGESFTLPDAPSKAGYIFLGWRSGDTTYRAEEEVDITSNMSFTAVWGNLPDIDPEEKPELPFYDVDENDWFYDAVYYVWEKGLMDGVEEHIFAPNDTLTRAMVWTIIARAEGVDTDGGATWYAKAQEWVVAKGISDGENPSAAITRQELVTMLWRLSGEPVVNYALTAPDADAISGWAYEAMRWAVSEGIIEGDDLGNLNPTANSTRAHAAAFMQRFCTAL